MAHVERREQNGKVTFVARWREPDGRQRKKSFPTERQANQWATSMQHDIYRGAYIDPDAGKVTFKDWAEEWLSIQTFNESTRDSMKARFKNHVYPVLGRKALASIRPSTIQAWMKSLDQLSAGYRRTIFVNVSTVFSAAVDDEMIAKNPCTSSAATRAKPRVERRKVQPWTSEDVQNVIENLAERYRPIAIIGAGLGLRQGEIFGLSPDDIDGDMVTIRRQVKVFSGSRLVFAKPKYERIREVPLPSHVASELTAYIKTFPPVEVTMSWGTPSGKPTTVPLYLVTREHNALNRNYFNGAVWKPALTASKIPDTRENGCHALRHYYASVLLDGGESIKALSEYLGHADPGFTLRTYTHLMPNSHDRTRQLIDGAFGLRPTLRPVPPTPSPESLTHKENTA